MKYLIELIQDFNSKTCRLFRNDIFSFFFTMLFVVYLIFLFPITYGANDNIGILFKAKEGFVSDFVSYFHIKLLYFLYQINNDIPWYGLILYFLHVLSLFVFVRSLARIKNFGTFLIPFLVVYLYFYSFFLFRLDYTSTSIMVGANSLFAFFVLLNNKSISVFHVFVLGILFSFSFMVRIKGVFAVLVYVLPIIGLVFLYKYSKKQHFVIYFFLPFLLLFMGDNIARTYFTSHEYQQYHEFNRLRGGLHEYPILSANKENSKIFKKNHWTQNDYKRLQYWMFFDERKYNINTLSNIYKYSVLKEEYKRSKYLNLYFSKISDLFKEYKWHVYFLLLVSILIIYEFSWLTGTVIIFYLLYIISGTVYMEIFYRFPTRIGWPVFLMVTSFMVYLTFNLLPLKFSTKKTSISFYHGSVIAAFNILGIFLVFFFNVNMQHRYHNANTKYSTNLPFTLTFNQLSSPLYQEKILYYQPVSGLKLDKMDPLISYHFNSKLIITGTNAFSPYFYKSLEKLGVKKGYEMIPAMINNPNAFIIASSKNNTFIKLLFNYIKENHKIECKVVVVDNLANGSVVLKLISKLK